MDKRVDVFLTDWFSTSAQWSPWSPVEVSEGVCKGGCGEVMPLTSTAQSWLPYTYVLSVQIPLSHVFS